MRGRKPRIVAIAPGDVAALRWVASGSAVPSYQARRAKVVLAIANGLRTQHVAEEMEYDAATVWRICRRYEHGGLSGLLADERRRA